MRFACPCLNVNIFVNSNVDEKKVERKLSNIVDVPVVSQLGALNEYELSKCEIRIEHEQLTGIVTHAPYSFCLCLNCNFLTHAIQSKSHILLNSNLKVNLNFFLKSRVIV